VKLKFLLIFGIIALVLLSGCSTDSNNSQNTDNLNPKENNEIKTDSSQDSSIKINLIAEKDLYEIFESFNIKLTKQYNGEEFQAVVAYKFRKENYEKVFYQGYIIDLSNEELNRTEGQVGYTGRRAFNVEKRNSTKENYAFPLEYFITEGEYIISVYLYSCEDIEKYGYKCNPVNSLFYLVDEEEEYYSTPEVLIENIKPLVSTAKTIIVRGGEKPAECGRDSDCSQESDKTKTGKFQCFLGAIIPKCIECNGSSCIEGYSCHDFECVKDGCSEDSDCTEYCEGCQDNSRLCKVGQCVECDKLHHKCSEGYVCEDWGCTSVEVLKAKKDCEFGEICGYSETRISPEYKCTFSSTPEKSHKCLECWGDSFCKEGYKCYNYDCVNK